MAKETQELPEFQPVDLGLPSGLKWAACNLGATKPQEYGDYYAWGETETKEEYDEDHYKFTPETEKVLRCPDCGEVYESGKFCPECGVELEGENGDFDEYAKYNSDDGLTVLEPGDDVAMKKSNGAWRMPTREEFDELRSKCAWERTTLEGVKGYKVTGFNGNSIFLPAAGYRNGDDLYGAGSYGYFWSRSLGSDYPLDAWYLDFNSDYHRMYDDYRRGGGYSVRAVCP